MIKSHVKSKGFNLEDFTESYSFNGASFKELKLTVIIPTPKDLCEILSTDIPHFHYYNHWGFIDMLCVDDELQFHFMEVKDHELTNCGWHTVREGLSLEETRMLYEYVSNIIGSLVVIPHDYDNAFNVTGALGVQSINDIIPY